MNVSIKILIGLAFGLLIGVPFALADDVAGWMRVSVETNGFSAISLPFVPFGTNFEDYVAGPFVETEDGESDELSRVGDILVLRTIPSLPFDVFVFGRVPIEVTRTTTLESGENLVSYGFPASAFPTSALPAGVSVSAGWRQDCLSGFLPWKVPVVLTNATTSTVDWTHGRPYSSIPMDGPRFVWMTIDPFGSFAELGIDQSARLTDVLRLHSSTGFSSVAEWEHCERFLPSTSTLVWRDDLSLSASGDVFYMVADASRDTDDDGIPDAVEQYVYGTSPMQTDTDGDGVSDSMEIVSGTDPLSVDEKSDYVFKETFEAPVVVPGDLNGQHGWVTTIPGAACVQTNCVCSGNAALELVARPESNEVVVATHAVTSAPAVVWADFQILNACANLCPLLSTNAFFSLDCNGHPVMSDGGRVVTNVFFTVDDGAWVRLTIRIDNVCRQCDYYVNGRIAGRELAFPAEINSLSELSIVGDNGAVDDICISAVRPNGLSSDGDALPDEWEFAYFGSLARDGSEDADGDGISDLDEFYAGTNPLSPDVDDDKVPDINPCEYQDGLFEVLWRTAGGLSTLPDRIPASAPFATSISSSVNHPNEPWLDSGGSPGGRFLAILEGQINIPVSGEYVFYATSDDGCAVKIDGRELLRDPTPHSGRTVSNSITLEAGWHSLEIVYYDNGGLDIFRLEWQPPGRNRSLISADALRHRVRNLAPYLMAATDVALCFEDEMVTLTASAVDADGEVVRLSVIADGTTLASTTETSTTFMLTNLPVGLQTLEVVALDDMGTATTNCLNVEVRALPKGYRSGLTISYYQFASVHGKLPEFNNLQPVSTGIVHRVYYPVTLSSWPLAPSNLVDNFGAVVEGALWIDDEGLYEFSLSADDGAVLYLDEKVALDHSGPHGMSEKTATLPLFRGLHSLRIGYFENGSLAGLMLKMRKGKGNFVEMPARCLFHRTSEVDDTDGDGIPDWWEHLYGFDPLDPSDAILDPDDDTLNNLAEFRAGTNPRLSDTDADGMPDVWEVAYGTYACAADALRDVDSDGLVNLDEFRFGTRPDLADTDGDGCADRLEILDVHSDPLIPDIVYTPISVGETVSPANFVFSTGTWRCDADGSVYALERAGSVGWVLDVPNDGFDALAVNVSQHEAYSSVDQFDLSLYVDGMFVCRQLVVAPLGGSSDAYFFLPEIKSGAHEFRMVWHNWEANTFLSVNGLRFVRFDGPDENEDGIADWKNHRDETASRFVDLPLESLVSPLCVEGCDLWRDILEVEVADPTTSAVYSVVKTIGDGFYVDIPLTADGLSMISMCDRTQAHVFSVAWSEFYVDSGLYVTNAFVLRTEDALRLSVSDGAECAMTVYRADAYGEWLAVTNWIQNAATAYAFDEAGSYLVRAVSRVGWWDERAFYARVDAVSSRFPKRNPAVVIDREMILSCPELSPRSLIEHDTELVVAVVTNDGGQVDLMLQTSADRDLGLVARISENGAVFDAVQVTPVWADNGNYYRVVQTYPDGSQLVEVSLLLGAFAADMSVRLEIFVAGVTFEDGTRTKVLTAEDFDGNGHCLVNFVRARGVTTSVCHRTYLYQNGKLLYDYAAE